MSDIINELLRFSNETGADFNRVHGTCFFGTEAEIIATITFVRGNIDQFHAVYEQWRGNCRTMNSPSWQNCDIGPIEDKFFFFGDDAQKLDPPMLRDRSKRANSFGNAFHDEWNVLFQIYTSAQESSRQLHLGPFFDEVRELWRKRKISYTDAVAKIQQMSVAPRPKEWMYHWQDRTD